VLLSSMGAHIHKLNFIIFFSLTSLLRTCEKRERERAWERERWSCVCVCVHVSLKSFRNSACPPRLTGKRNSTKKKVMFVGICHTVSLVRFCMHGQGARHQRVRVSLWKWGSYQHFFLALTTRSLAASCGSNQVDTYLCLWLVGWLISCS
jgi:hypothetical protein